MRPVLLLPVCLLICLSGSSSGAPATNAKLELQNPALKTMLEITQREVGEIKSNMDDACKHSKEMWAEYKKELDLNARVARLIYAIECGPASVGSPGEEDDVAVHLLPGLKEALSLEQNNCS